MYRWLQSVFTEEYTSWQTILARLQTLKLLRSLNFHHHMAVSHAQGPTLRCLLSLPVCSTTLFSRHPWPGTRSHPQPHSKMSLIQINSSISTRNILGWVKSPVLLMGQDNFFHSNTVIFMKSITPKSITQKETRIPQWFKLFKQKFQRSQKTRCSEHHWHTYLFEKGFTHL